MRGPLPPYERHGRRRRPRERRRSRDRWRRARYPRRRSPYRREHDPSSSSPGGAPRQPPISVRAARAAVEANGWTWVAEPFVDQLTRVGTPTSSERLRLLYFDHNQRRSSGSVVTASAPIWVSDPNWNR